MEDRGDHLILPWCSVCMSTFSLIILCDYQCQSASGSDRRALDCRDQRVASSSLTASGVLYCVLEQDSLFVAYIVVAQPRKIGIYPDVTEKC